MEKPENIGDVMRLAKIKGPEWYPDLPHGKACERAYQRILSELN